MQQAFRLPSIETDRRLMYREMSNRFLSATEDVPFSSEADGIDFEGKFGVVADTMHAGNAFGRIDQRIVRAPTPT